METLAFRDYSLFLSISLLHKDFLLLFYYLYFSIILYSQCFENFKNELL